MIISICSLHANPLHAGHLDYLKAAKELAGPDGKLWVILNSDAQIERRGDPLLLSQAERLEILQELKCVDLAGVAFDDDGSVATTIEGLVTAYEHVFGMTEFILCNGGDRGPDNKSSAESQVCQRLGIREVWGVGGTDKRNSSSDIRRKILEHYK